MSTGSNYIGELKLELTKALHFELKDPGAAVLKEAKLVFEPKVTHCFSLTTDSGEHEPAPKERYVELVAECRIPYASFLQLLRDHKDAHGDDLKLWENGHPVSLDEVAHA